MTKGTAAETSEGTEARGRGRLVFVIRSWHYDKTHGLHARSTELPLFATLGTCLAALVVVRVLGMLL